MNFSVPMGLLLGIGAILFGTSTGMKSTDIFFNLHAAVVVLGGTAAAGLICFPAKQFVNLAKVFFRALTGRANAANIETINEIVQLSRLQDEGQPLGAKIESLRNPFLKESLQLMEQGGLSDDEFEDVLEKRVETQNEQYRRDGFTFKTIGKFPPAFGLVGTSIGMIGLLQGLGEADAFKRIGPSMSVSLVATFYGLVLANVVLIPMGENLSQASEVDLNMRRIVLEGVRLLRANKHPLLVEEYLKSYLPPQQRSKIQAATAT
jgi:chemotaxis protein MotA